MTKSLRLSVDNKIGSSFFLYLSMIIYISYRCLPMLASRLYVSKILIFASLLFFLIGIFANRVVIFHTIISILLVTVLNYCIYKTQWATYHTFATMMNSLSQFWFPAIISIELFSNRSVFDRDKLRGLLSYFLLIFSLSCITTIIGNMKYDTPSRELSTGILDESIRFKYRSENIGGFGFCYLILFVAPSLIHLIKWTKRKILFIPLILTYACAIASQYLILILLLAAVSVCVLFENMNRNQKIIFAFSVIIVVFVFLVSADVVFPWFISITERYESLQMRIREIYQVINNESLDSYSDISLRLNVYKVSWDQFLAKPFFGGWVNSKLGGHSQILDLCGSLGLFGIWLLVIMLRSIGRGIKPYYSALKGSSKRMIKIMLAAAFALAVLNPVFVSGEIGLGIFVILASVFYSEDMETRRHGIISAKRILTGF